MTDQKLFRIHIKGSHVYKLLFCLFLMQHKNSYVKLNIGIENIYMKKLRWNVGLF